MNPHFSRELNPSQLLKKYFEPLQNFYALYLILIGSLGSPGATVLYMLKTWKYFPVLSIASILSGGWIPPVRKFSSSGCSHSACLFENKP